MIESSENMEIVIESSWEPENSDWILEKKVDARFWTKGVGISS